MLLHLRIDGDRTDAAYGTALVEEVRADDSPVALGDDAVDRRVRDEGLSETGGGVDRREVAREPVRVVDAGERVVHDPRDGFGIPGSGWPDGEGGREGEAHVVTPMMVA